MKISQITFLEATDFCERVGLKCLSLSGALKCGVERCLSDGNSLALICGESVRLYTQSFEFVDALISLLGKNNVYEFCCVETYIIDYIAKNRKCYWRSDCTLFAYFGSVAKKPVTKEGEFLGEINKKFICLINNNYTYKHHGSKKKLLDEINSRPSSAMYVENKPVAWALLHDDFAMGVMFVLPKYRRLGYAEAVTLDLMAKVMGQGEIPYVQIVKGNEASEALAKKLGFEPQFDVSWIGVRL